MSSETLTDSPARESAGLTPWQFFLLLAMLGATVAVMTARDTHPAALLLLSAAVISAGFVAATVYRALSALLGRSAAASSRPAGRTRALLEEDKALVLRSIKELEFDRSMGKVSEADFAEIGGRLRARALALMEQLEGMDAAAAAARPPQPRAAAPAPPPNARVRACPECGTENDTDARFCKSCGSRVGG